jgi:hypothetical protein
LGRRHHHAQDADRDRRQAEPDDALDEAGEQEGRRDEENEAAVDHAPLSHCRHALSRRDVTANAVAFALAWGAGRSIMPR